MFVFLNVTRSNSSGNKLGVLQIGKNEPYADADGSYFEWSGMNATSDAGTWRWSNHPMYDMWVIELISNERQAVVMHLENSEWLLGPPSGPVFKSGAKGRLAYRPPGLNAITGFWQLLSA